MIPRLAFTPGEPAGIGPDLAIMYAQRACACELVAFADADLLQQRAGRLGLPLRLRPVDLKQPPEAGSAGELAVIHIPVKEPVVAGQLAVGNAHYVLHSLDRAIAACQGGQCRAMVTGPVQKSVINEAGIAFSGHTEYLAEQTGAPHVVMMLATEGLKVALVTTHLPVAQVAASITPGLLTEVVTILHRELQEKFRLARPRILVCGLNPHAGENGHLGREEIEVITPTLRRLRRQGIDCRGPLPADTLFTPKYLDEADAVLAMYHDQGLPVLKFKGFGRAANITLGLPLIRTSVDHGTALDLAGTGNIDSGSLDTAIEFALAMA